jgi:hypothetical protein
VDILARSGNVIIKKERADTLHKSTGYRLCVLASGSLITDIFNSRIVIMVSCLHLGQNRGKFFNTVSFRILSRVLLLQTGHNIHSISSIMTSYRGTITPILFLTINSYEGDNKSK